MNVLNTLDRAPIGAALERLGADGWLLFDFHGCNPVAQRLLPGGMGTRRIFVWIPREGPITAIVHRIEMQPFLDFEGTIVPFARHAELDAALRTTLAGKTAAMEISPLDSVPYLDRIPWGVVDLLRSIGVTVVPSADLVTRFAATWSASETAEHVAAAEILRDVALAALASAVRRADTGLTESQLQQEVVAAMEGRGLSLTSHPIVCFGPSGANPHYEPRPGHDRTLGPDELVLLDLWGGMRPGAVFADQTWMGFSGRSVPAKVQEVWRTVRDARDAAVAALRARIAAGEPVFGYLGDRAARDVIERAGYGEWFVHRTGHSIDRDLHGSGPHLDDYETHDDRALLPGTGCSVEPGIYLPGEFGVRSEINLYWGSKGLTVTPSVPQIDLVLP
ncbi:MAG TPA: M24 family metallopeptidase [Gemmatimonadales bacterium]|jgi:Xaa-Pro aminopeptidase|nr:M24 family metallopeptidase [Gemmatimonadales bacterium]